MAEAGGGPISVIARHMQLIRDDFISELFDKMKAEIRGLDYDARMADLWRASITENFVTAVHYLDRDTPQSLVEAPAAALAYARAAAQRDIPLSGLVRAHRLGHARFLEVAMQYVSLLEPADRVSTIIELVNRSARLVDLVADQLIVAYEHEHDRWLSRRSGLQQQWVSELLADTPVDVPRAERALGYRLDGVHIAAVVWVDSAVPIGDVVAQFDQVRCLLAGELGPELGPVANSLRDKTIFLAARGEHYWLKLFVFFFPFTDQIAAFKIIMLCLWWGAATSKLNHHFPYVVAVMTSNNALLRSRVFNPIKHLLYRDHANDLRPSWLPKLMAHGGGTTAEFLVPGILVLVADGHPWRWFLIGFMVLFHLNILSNLPMGVPLEWNVFFIFSLCYLFGHYGAITATDLRSPLLLAIVIAVVAVVIMGNLLPEKISFLPAMRYYAGNWATSIWCFRGDAEATMETSVVKSSALVVNQLAKLYDGATAEIMTDKVAAFRAMHTHGRALNGLLPRALDDEAHYRIREGEIVAGPLVGWNFGEGHLHNEQLVAAVQRRCNFADGDLRVIILEGQPIHVQKQWYRIVDAKTGLFEAGYVTVEDMLSRQPWPEPGDEFPVHVTTQRGTPSKP